MSYDFNATSRYIDGLFNSQYDSEGMTLVCWMKASAAVWGGTAHKYMMWVGEAVDASTNQLRMAYGKGSTADRVTATAKDVGGDNDAHNGLTADHDNIWQIFISVFTSNTSRINYAQGTIDVGAEATGEVTAGSAIDAIRIGASHLGFLNCEGLLAEVAVYNKALNTTEIDEFWTSEGTGNSPLLVAPSNLIGYWPLNEDSSTHANQGSDTGGLLTVNNAVYDADHPIITYGTPVLNTVRRTIEGITDADPNTPWG